MEEKYKIGFENAREFIYELFFSIIYISNFILRMILLLGAITSFVLLAKFFPEKASELFILVYPIFDIIFKVLIFLLYFLVGCLFGYTVFRFGFWYRDLIIRSRERNRVKRKERLDELVNEITKKLKGRKK